MNRSIVRLAVLDHRVSQLERSADITDRQLATLATPMVALQKEVNQ